MLEIHAIRREDLLTAFSLSVVLRLRRRFQAFAELYRQQRGNTSCGAANRRSEKNAFSEAASIFPLRLLLRGLKGASSPFLVDPARRNRWCFSGSLLARKENLTPRNRALPPRNVVSLFRTPHFASAITLSIYLPPAQYSAVPHPTATRRGCVPPAPSFFGRMRASFSRASNVRPVSSV